MERELIEIADRLCEGYQSCEECPLWNKEEYEKDEENWKCDFYKLTT